MVKTTIRLLFFAFAFALHFLANPLRANEHPLDCISFEESAPMSAISSCCWQTGNHSMEPVKIHMAADPQWYRKRFRAVGLLPPESAFVVLSADGAQRVEEAENEGGATIWESCDFCTRTGELELTVRQWQSVTSELEICWRPSEVEEWPPQETCMLMDPRTQFSLDPLALRVPANMNIRLYFRLKNRSRWRTTVATVIIDYIYVHSDFCPTGNDIDEMEGDLPKDGQEIGQENVHLINGGTQGTQGKEEEETERNLMNSFHTELEELAGRGGGGGQWDGDEADKREGRNETGDMITYELAGMENDGKREGGTAQQRAAKIKKLEASEDDPMNAIFGEALANFLQDPNYDGKEGAEATKPSMLVKKNIRRLNGPNTLIKVHKNTQSCATFGGCHFENSACGFSNSQMFSSRAAQFLRKQIGTSYVVEAKISPGEVAVFESPTNMTDVDYTVLFNHFQSASADSQQKPKFSACCYIHGREPSELECPFETDSFASSFGPFPGIGPINNTKPAPTASEWKSGKIGCPRGTSKLMFTCDFYGSGTGICALHSVRLHRVDDKDLREPCLIREDFDEQK